MRYFPADAGVRNQLGISYLLQGQPHKAKEVFQEVLDTWPGNGLAQVGFVLCIPMGLSMSGKGASLREITSLTSGEE